MRRVTVLLTILIGLIGLLLYMTVFPLNNPSDNYPNFLQDDVFGFPRSSTPSPQRQLSKEAIWEAAWDGVDFEQLILDQYVPKDCFRSGSIEEPLTSFGRHLSDLDGDGEAEALVLASTCAAGQGVLVDIQKVLKRDLSGEIIELSLHGARSEVPDGLTKEGDDFRYSQTFFVKDGRLARAFRLYDENAGDPPCCPSGEEGTAYFQWDGSEFVISKVSEESITGETIYSQEQRDTAFPVRVDPSTKQFQQIAQTFTVQEDNLSLIAISPYVSYAVGETALLSVFELDDPKSPTGGTALVTIPLDLTDIKRTSFNRFSVGEPIPLQKGQLYSFVIYLEEEKSEIGIGKISYQDVYSYGKAWYFSKLIGGNGAVLDTNHDWRTSQDDLTFKIILSETP